jgi:hypothetical protein
VAAGKEADFVVLAANPLERITNSRRIDKVYLRGADVDRAALRADVPGGGAEIRGRLRRPAVRLTSARIQTQPTADRRDAGAGHQAVMRQGEAARAETADARRRSRSSPPPCRRRTRRCS